MKKQLRRLSAVLLVVAISIAFRSAPSSSGRGQAAVLRQTEVIVPADTNVLVAVEGSFSTAGKERILARLNAIRKEAYQEGLVSSYVPQKWSYALEWLAQIRAAESAIMRSHTRPNGKTIYSMTYGAESADAENLAWNLMSGEQSMMAAIEQWYEEKAAYVSQKNGDNPQGITAHYAQMIDPQNSATALATFQLSHSDAWTATSQLLGSQAVASEQQTGEYGAVRQVMEVAAPALSELKISVPSVLTVGESRQISATARLNAHSDLGLGTVSAPVTIQAAHWNIIPVGLASVDSNGLVTAHGRGGVTLELHAGQFSQSIDISLQDPAKWIDVDGFWYYLLGDGSFAKQRWIGDYYVGADGRMLTSAFTPDGYRVNASGKWVKGSWKQDSRGWWYEFVDGVYYRARWAKIDGKWYHFQPGGYLDTAVWIGHYYVDHNGVMLTSAFTPDGYRVDASGKWSKGGWKRDSSGWWYGFGDGSYYHDGWRQLYGLWYHFQPNGYLSVSTWIGSCYVDDNGRMLTNTVTPDGWYVNGSGYASGRAW